MSCLVMYFDLCSKENMLHLYRAFPAADLVGPCTPSPLLALQKPYFMCENLGRNVDTLWILRGSGHDLRIQKDEHTHAPVFLFFFFFFSKGQNVFFFVFVFCFLFFLFLRFAQAVDGLACHHGIVSGPVIRPCCCCGGCCEPHRCFSIAWRALHLHARLHGKAALWEDRCRACCKAALWEDRCRACCSVVGATGTAVGQHVCMCVCVAVDGAV